VANIARVTALLERSNDPNVRQALRYAQRAWVQLDQQAPASLVGDERVGDSRSQPQVEQQAIARDPNAAITTMVRVGVKPPEGGGSHLWRTTQGSPTAHANYRTFIRRSMRGAMFGQCSTRGDGNAR
jgi:hypothetical protein